MSNTTAVILAAGLGKPLQFPPKMLLPLARKPLVSHITDRVLAIFDTSVIVAQASYHNQLATQYPQAKTVLNQKPMAQQMHFFAQSQRLELKTSWCC